MNVGELKKILEDPEEPITPFFVLTILDNLVGLKKIKEELYDIDYIWHLLENKYKINPARRDSISAAVAFYENPSSFFMNPNVFDKMGVAFNGHNIVPGVINKPSPYEATFAIMAAREVISEIYDNKYGSKYPLFPDVARCVALIYFNDGLVMLHPSISEYQKNLDDIIDMDNKETIKKEVSKLFKEYEDNPKQTLSKILKDIESPVPLSHPQDFIANNIHHIIGIDIYLKSMSDYEKMLIKKVVS